MQRPVALMEGETYHVFNRGAHKQRIFIDEVDHRRFQILLLLANSTERIDVGNILTKYQGPALVNLFENEKPDMALVDIFAYSLMPNHFHLVLRQKIEGGISKFMLKVCTGYSMYFNLKHDHSGTLFQGKFKSSHIDTDPYHKWIFAYVHLNPAALIESTWENSGIENTPRAKEFLGGYSYSSYFDYYTAHRPERMILAHQEALQYIDNQKDVNELLATYAHGRVLYPGLEA